MLKNFILSAFLMALSASVSAGIMADLNSMFMSNSTAPTTITTQDRNGYFGGSFYMRAPMQSWNIVSFDPPRADAGCGGVDLYLGSFTFISSQQIIALFRQIAANAVGLAFKAAIDAISPSLGKLMHEFQTLLQNLNDLAKNTCNLAHMIVDPGANALASATGGDAGTVGVKLGQWTDDMAKLSDYLANPKGVVDKASKNNPQAGNATVKAIVNSGISASLGLAGIANPDGSVDDPSNPNSLNNRILISLLGFKIDGAPCTITNGSGNLNTTTPSSSLGQTSCGGENTITLDALVKGGGVNSTDPSVIMYLWECVNTAGTPAVGAVSPTDPQICTQMKKSAFAYQGIRGYVNSMLFGVGNPTGPADVTGTSIVGLFNAGTSATMTATQIKFIKQSGFPVPFLTKVTDPSERYFIATRLGDYTVSCMAGKVGETLYRAGNGIKDVAGYPIHPDAIVQLIKLREEYLTYQERCYKKEAIQDVAQKLTLETSLNTRTK